MTEPATVPGTGPGPVPWPTGAATGIGSLPGIDPREAVRTVLGELPDLPHLPELPARGPGADMVGRAAALLVDLHVDLQPAGWRLVPRPGLDERRGAAYLQEDLDELHAAAEGLTGALKVQVAGPWTLAAALELPRGGPVLGDAGAVRDVAASLAEAVGSHLAEVSARVPGAELVVQVDEPALPAVLAGRVPTASGFDRVPAVDGQVVEQLLGSVVAAAGVPVAVHCCAEDPPLALVRRTGATAVSVDAARLGLSAPGRHDDALGEAVEAGLSLWLGLVPATGAGGAPADAAATAAPARRLWRRLGLAPELLGRSVLVTPACGLAGADPSYARAAMAAARAAGRSLVEDPEG